MKINRPGKPYNLKDKWLSHIKAESRMLKIESLFKDQFKYVDELGNRVDYHNLNIPSKRACLAKKHQNKYTIYEVKRIDIDV
jgi:hypothetical protein